MIPDCGRFFSSVTSTVSGLTSSVTDARYIGVVSIAATTPNITPAATQLNINQRQWNSDWSSFAKSSPPAPGLDRSMRGVVT